NKAIEGKSEEQQIKEYKEYEEYDAAWNQRAALCYAENPTMSWSEVQERCGVNQWPGPMCCINPFRPAGLYECMLQRVMPYTLRGFIYYQGESDDHKPQMYAKLLARMIERWREDWEDDTLPFLMVQLPMHRYEADPDFKHWCRIREAQMKVFRTVKNTGIAVILDCGEFNEIHPKDKVPVGERLALQALWTVYHKLEEKNAFGPIFRSLVIEGEKACVSFDYAEEGFEIRGDGSGFELAGEDGVYVPATVHTGEAANVLYVSAAQVEKPKFVRYCWTNYGPVNYFGKNGIPLAPFRSSRNDEQEATETKVEIRQVMEL
ncbi:MAG: sialate O-acetylesterase, partial [Lachnospiraceae bacterium]|nr:sialate O-acetylesterase [Lachnospiraceae bacterium]